MALIPGGTFAMGCTPGQSDCQPDEVVHDVTLTRDLRLMRVEVTQEMFEETAGYQPSAFAGCPDCPAEQVTWHEAASFANSLSALAGLEGCYACSGSGPDVECEDTTFPYLCGGYRLPTEAEWEYAARCGEDFLYAGADDVDAVAWYAANSGRETHPAGAKAPNACGLYDMSGNVWEWVQDRFASDYYSSSPAIDPPGPTDGATRVQRGGSRDDRVTMNLRASFRIGRQPTVTGSNLGFRVARNP